MEQKQRFVCIDEELFADVMGTVKAQENKKADKHGQEVFAIVNSEVVSLDDTLRENKNCMAIVMRAVEKHAGNRSCISDISMLNLLNEQVSECAGKRFRSLSILSKQDVMVAAADYLDDVEPCMIVDVVTTINEIYSNGFIISAE